MRVQLLTWMAALMFALLLPTAFAQSFAGLGSNPWIYFTVNTVILWFVFASILYLISKDEQGKEKTMVQLGAFGLAAILSWNFVGGSGFIWQVGRFAPIFNLKFVVNTAIMSALLYFLATWLMGENAPKEGGKNIGTWLLVILFAGVFASKMPYYLWEQGSGAAFISLLIGDRGILTLTDNRLWLFITAYILSAWVLNYWQVSKDMPKLTYFFAFIIASRVAHAENPISGDTMITVAELISAWLIGAGMSKSEGSPAGGKGFVSFIIAFIIVDIIVSTLFPGKGFLFSFSNMTDGFLTGGLIILIALLGFVFYARASGRSGAGGLSPLLNDGWANGWSWLKNLLAKNVGIARALNSIEAAKDTDLPGEYTQQLKRMRLETYILMSYMQRQEVFATKMDNLEKIKNAVIESQTSFGAQSLSSIPAIQKELMEKLEGVPKQSLGVANYSYLIDMVLAEIEKLIREVPNMTKLPSNPGPDAEAYGKEKIKEIETSFEKVLERANELKKQLQALYAIEAYRPLVIDVYTISGRNKRGFGFAKSGNSVVEVDCRGYSVEDMSRLELQGLRLNLAADPAKLLSNIRKFKKKDVLFTHPLKKDDRFGDIVEHVLTDWRFYLADLERLAYHPHSRRIQDYEFLWRSGSNSFANVPQRGRKEKSDIGFDHESLSNPGFFAYQGRSSYDVTSDSDLADNPSNENPYSGASVEGLISVIEELAKKKGSDQQKVQEYLQKIVMVGNTYIPKTKDKEGTA